MAICSRCGTKWKMSEINTCPLCKEKRDKQRDKEYKRNEESNTIYQSARWRKIRQEVIVRDLFKCVKCGKTIGIKPKDHAVDHIIPLTKGGKPFDKSNLQTLCTFCHGEKRRYE